MDDFNIFGDSFSDWMDNLNRLVLERVELRIRDLPDLAFRDAFDAGTSPEEFYDEAVIPELEDLGWSA